MKIFNRSLRLSSLILAVISFAGTVPGAAQETVSLSRYRVRLTVATNGVDGQTLDQVAFDERCRDDDGCEITLVLTGFDQDSEHGRIFLFTDSLAWARPDGSIVENADGYTDSVTSVTDSINAGCNLSDADNVALNVDTTPAFAIQLVTLYVGANAF